ncbi:hypothetical protein [Clostridium psychrophilum]|uniref:hypothetical protein n=1 Tax=Clostridium psychrophilum TaxID=132926 RepID=UPI001C0D75DD|nr:hypothetical protein [Clostridium psychrophilum]MBU3180205.1 hypothetical protein [Clostridium psychrophilum]
MKDIKQLKKIRLTLEEIEKFYSVKDYNSLAILIKKLIEEKIIVPIKASKTNGQNPALYKRYSLVKKEEDNSKYEDEIRNELYIGFDMAYYKSHIGLYKRDRKYVIGLSNYIRVNKQKSDISISINELSFEIWQEEKFLKDGRGKTIIKNVGLDIEKFNFYTTPEPFVFYSFSKQNKQRVLIIENKDTWYSIRKLMHNGCNNVLGTAIDTIIYASGKGRFKGLLEYNLMVEEYLRYPREVL